MNSLTQAATSGVTGIWTLFLNLLVFIVLAGALFLFANRMGRGSFISLIAAFYVGFAIFSVFPYGKLLSGGTGGLSGSVSALVLYAIFTAISYYILQRSAGGFLSLGNAGVIILSLLTAGFLIALSYHSFSLEGIYSFPAMIKMYFAPPEYFFWWFVAPLVGLLAVAR